MPALACPYWPCPKAAGCPANSTYIERMSMLGGMAGMCPAVSVSPAQLPSREASPHNTPEELPKTQQCALVCLGPGRCVWGVTTARARS